MWQATMDREQRTPEKVREKLGGNPGGRTYEGTTDDGVAGRPEEERRLWPRSQSASRSSPAPLACPYNGTTRYPKPGSSKQGKASLPTMSTVWLATSTWLRI